MNKYIKAALTIASTGLVLIVLAWLWQLFQALLVMM